MKNLLLSALLILLVAMVSQGQDLPAPDTSPMDMAYFPDNFAHDRKPGEKPIARVIYSRPRKGERVVFGKLVPYGKVWRTGANEATEIKFYQDVTLGGKKVKAGTYSLFSIPGEKEWTLILNTDLDYWGAYSYNNEGDILRTEVPVKAAPTGIEAFTITFKEDKTVSMILGWDKVIVEVPITVQQ